MTYVGLEDQQEFQLVALRVTQPIGDFYLASMRSSDLFRLSYFDIRHLNQDNGIDQFMGIQRTLNEKRVQQIAEYVTSVDATFPTAVVLAVDERCARIEELDCGSGVRGSGVFKLFLKNIPNPEPGEDPVLFRQIARVIDGQHRIKGLEGYGGANFEVNVAIFIGLDLAAQASIFSVVNLAQTKVNPSLVYDLFAYDEARSPEKTCHELAVALDGASSSPFYHKIKRLGVATDGRFGETLSQATFVRSLLPYITDTVARDRDVGRRGGHLPKPSAEHARRCIFRLPFVLNKDDDIGAVLWAYFDAVRQRWPEAWDNGGPGLILNRSTGFQALMRLLREAFLSVAKPGDVPDSSAFSKIFSIVKLTDNELNSDNFKPGSSGAAALYSRMRTDIASTYRLL